MRPVVRFFSSRRAFLSGIAMIMPAVFLGHPRLSHAARADLKSLVSQMEWEFLKSGRPKRSPLFHCSGTEEKACLWTDSGGKRRPVCSMNETGRFIWEACDGDHTADEISRSVHERFLVTFHQARVDVLAFLWSLKARGAVE
jgi:hypothetical protein